MRISNSTALITCLKAALAVSDNEEASAFANFLGETNENSSRELSKAPKRWFEGPDTTETSKKSRRPSDDAYDQSNSHLIAQLFNSNFSEYLNLHQTDQPYSTDFTEFLSLDNQGNQQHSSPVNPIDPPCNADFSQFANLNPEAQPAVKSAEQSHTSDLFQFIRQDSEFQPTYVEAPQYLDLEPTGQRHYQASGQPTFLEQGQQHYQPTDQLQLLEYPGQRYHSSDQTLFLDQRYYQPTGQPLLLDQGKHYYQPTEQPLLLDQGQQYGSSDDPILLSPGHYQPTDQPRLVDTGDFQYYESQPYSRPAPRQYNGPGHTNPVQLPHERPSIWDQNPMLMPYNTTKSVSQPSYSNADTTTFYSNPDATTFHSNPDTTTFHSDAGTTTFYSNADSTTLCNVPQPVNHSSFNTAYRKRESRHSTSSSGSSVQNASSSLPTTFLPGSSSTQKPGIPEGIRNLNPIVFDELAQSPGIIESFKAALAVPTVKRGDSQTRSIKSKRLRCFVEFIKTYLRTVNDDPSEFDLEIEISRLNHALLPYDMTQTQSLENNVGLRCLIGSLISRNWSPEEVDLGISLVKEQEIVIPVNRDNADAMKITELEGFLRIRNTINFRGGETFIHVLRSMLVIFSTRHMRQVMMERFAEGCSALEEEEAASLKTHFRTLYDLFFNAEHSETISRLFFGAEVEMRRNDSPTAGGIGAFRKSFRTAIRDMVFDLIHKFTSVEDVLAGRKKTVPRNFELMKFYNNTTLNMDFGFRVCTANSMYLTHLKNQLTNEWLAKGPLTLSDDVICFATYRITVHTVALFRLADLFYKMLSLLPCPEDYANALEALENTIPQFLLCSIQPESAWKLMDVLAKKFPSDLFS